MLRRIGLCVLVLVVASLILLKIIYGGGTAYPKLSTTPLVSAQQVDSLVSLDFPPGNVAVAPDGRIFFNYHPFAKAARFASATVFELVDGKAEPFPDLAYQSSYRGVLGMTVDAQNRLWMVEPGGLDYPQSRLLAFDIVTRQKVIEYWFPKGAASFAQDLQVTADGAWVILADTGIFKFTPPHLIVFDVARATFKTVLGAGPATSPQNWIIQTKHGPHRLLYGLVTFSVGLDGIALSDDQKWLYLAPMSHANLYRLPLRAVLEAQEMDLSLPASIELVTTKPLSDGIAADREGRVYVTDVEHGGIALYTPATGMRTLVQLPQVVWADGVVVAPDHRVIFTDSAIPAYIHQLALPPSRTTLAAGAPYHIYAVRMID